MTSFLRSTQSGPFAPRRLVPVLALLLLGLPLQARSQERTEGPRARITEEVRTLQTYPFSEPNPVPVLVRDRRLYPYHTFEGYAHISEPRDWTVVTLENEHIQVFVLPEAGGKVWGAVVKETGHEFIYRNEVMKFRNIALRGPWTSGGIELNFGVIGHTPATATPVDYRLRENDDGSVSCIVGSMDLPSRTHWRVEIRLPADRAYFETRVLWTNPTFLEQPYYNWMTGAAFARDDLEMAMPGSAYLQHSGQVEEWPVDPEGRYLPAYDNNRFGGHKSYHVVGELHDFFGGYYHDAGYGFGHWSRYEEMPGQKLWLWALSREGGVWEELLTDTDGQYVEFQAGRLLVQYSPGSAVNPITQATFHPQSTSAWSETWFPVEGIGGLTEASREGAMHVILDGGDLTVAVNAFGATRDTVKVWSGGELMEARPVELQVLEPRRVRVRVDPDRPYRVQLPVLGLAYTSDPEEQTLSRPFQTPPEAWEEVPRGDRAAFQARERARGRYYRGARDLYEEALEWEPWHREARLGLAALDLRSARFREGLEHVTRILQLDAYDAEANFLAGLLYRALGQTADARDALGWAARSPAFRAGAYVGLAELMIREGDWEEAIRCGRLALDFDRHGPAAWRVLAVAGRHTGNGALAEEARTALLRVDPLHHLVPAEEYLETLTPATARRALDALGGEYPEQTLLEMVAWYAGAGLRDDARALLTLAWQEDLPEVSISGGLTGPGADAGRRFSANPLLQAWRGYLRRDGSSSASGPDPSFLATVPDPSFSFPYRPESLPVLRWASRASGNWVWKYLLALNLWALDRDQEAGEILASLGQEPDFGPFYVTRGLLLQDILEADPRADLQRGVALDPENRVLHVYLLRHLQDAGDWAPSLEAVREAKERFPEDFTLDLMEAKALINLGAPRDAAELLADTHVLPSENGRESHLLWEQAHTLAGLSALEAGDAESARRDLLLAMQWPEHLGQGRPYQPEERLPRFLLGMAEDALDHEEEAAGAYRAVVDGTPGLARALAHGPKAPIPGLGSGLDLLAISALERLGQEEAVERLLRSWDTAMEEIMEGLDGDLGGAMILRTLRLSSGPLGLVGGREMTP